MVLPPYSLLTLIVKVCSRIFSTCQRRKPASLSDPMYSWLFVEGPVPPPPSPPSSFVAVLWPFGGMYRDEGPTFRVPVSTWAHLMLLFMGPRRQWNKYLRFPEGHEQEWPLLRSHSYVCLCLQAAFFNFSVRLLASVCLYLRIFSSVCMCVCLCGVTACAALSLQRSQWGSARHWVSRL